MFISLLYLVIMLHIYYAHSIQWAHQATEWSASDIIAVLEHDGHKILSEEFYTQDVSRSMSPGEIYKRDIAMIQEADLVLANISNPSLWVWYELWYAESLNKKIVCFYQAGLHGTISRMITGNTTRTIHAIQDIQDITWIISISA